jgi:hypothetical protein
VIEAFGVYDTDEQGAETGQAVRLRVDALPARLDRDRATAAVADIEVQPVLAVLRSCTTWNQIRCPRPAGSTMQPAPAPSSSSGTPTSRQYASQLAKPFGGGSSSYPRVAGQKRASGSGSAQSMTS